MPGGIEAKSVTKEDTKLLRHYGTKVVSEINYENSNNERKPIVGWAYQPNNEKPIQAYPPYLYHSQKLVNNSSRAGVREMKEKEKTCF